MLTYNVVTQTLKIQLTANSGYMVFVHELLFGVTVWPLYLSH